MSIEQDPAYSALIPDLSQLLPRELLERIIGLGVDRCNVLRIQRDIEEIGTFIPDNFTDEEIVYCEQAQQPSLRAQRYAARFAAKEAVIKALEGIDRKGFSYKDISILKGEISGKPYIFLEGKAKARAEELGVKEIFITITHEKDSAIAWCITAK